MSDSLFGRTVARAINHYVVWLAAFSICAAAILFATSHHAAALGVLAGPLLMSALALRLKRTVRIRSTKSAETKGMSLGAIVGAMPGVVIIAVGLLIGGEFIVFMCTAMGTFLLTFSGLFLVLVRSQQSK